MKNISLLELGLFPVWLIAQSGAQTIRGIVLDKDTREPLTGAAISIKDAPGAVTGRQEIGSFRLLFGQ